VVVLVDTVVVELEQDYLVGVAAELLCIIPITTLLVIRAEMVETRLEK